MKKKVIEFVPKYDGAMLIFDNGDEIHFEKTKIADVFCKFGGSFVKALGLALYVADRNNTIKLMGHFDEYVQEYIEKFILEEKNNNLVNTNTFYMLAYTPIEKQVFDVFRNTIISDILIERQEIAKYHIEKENCNTLSNIPIEIENINKAIKDQFLLDYKK